MIHPRAYLNSLRHKMRIVYSIIEIKDIIRQRLIESAAVLFASVKNDINSFTNFETLVYN